MKIKKVSQTVPTSAQVINGYTESNTDSYSANYQNAHNVVVSPTQPTDKSKVWLQHSENLYTGSVDKIGYLIAGDGSEIANPDGCISTHVELEPNTEYAISYYATDYSFGMRIAEYTSGKSFIKRTVLGKGNGILTTTSTTQYIKLSYGINYVSNIKIEKGASVTEDKSYILNSNSEYEKFLPTKFGDIVVDSIKTKNLYNSSTDLLGWIINTSGNIITTTGYRTSQPIAVEPSTTYTISRVFNTSTTSSGEDLMRIGYYTFDGSYISRPFSADKPWTITTPDNCYFIRLSYQYGTLNEQTNYNVQLEEGSIATPYRPYQNLGEYNDYYATEEIKIGYWYNGKPLYRRFFTTNVSLSANAWTNLRYKSGEEAIIKCIYSDDANFNGGCYPFLTRFSGNYIQVYSPIAVTIIAYYIEYTKTTD